jgi:two-component system NtrC family sensor kinase
MLRLFNSISFKLFVLLSLILVGAFGIYSYVSLQHHGDHLMGNVLKDAMTASDLIKRSTRYSMLKNQKEDLYHIVKAVGDEPGVDSVRIINKKGEIMFSTTEGEAGRTVDIKAESCNVCHTSSELENPPKTGKRHRIYTGSGGYRILGLINPIYNEPDCYNASCHAHPPAKTILGVLDVKMSLKQLDKGMASSRRRMISISVFFIICTALFSGAFIWRIVHVPVRKLTRGTMEVSKSNLNFEIRVNSSDEIGNLANSFNSMTASLRKSRGEIEEWNRTLEDKVKEKTEELSRAQSHLIQSEKMASLGKLSTAVAHEINNPLSGILVYSKLLMKILSGEECTPDEKETVRKYITIIQGESKRCGDIVKNMLVFARHDRGEFKDEALSNIIDRAVQLLQHTLDMSNVKLETGLEDAERLVYCDPNQVQQALIAMMTNAVDAMPGGGKLTISTSFSEQTDAFTIVLADNGMGIPAGVIGRIFDPFFTTKESSGSIGIGLSVVYGIIRRHGGTIVADSKAGEGTRFTITLPRVCIKPRDTDGGQWFDTKTGETPGNNEKGA